MLRTIVGIVVASTLGVGVGVPATTTSSASTKEHGTAHAPMTDADTGRAAFRALFFLQGRDVRALLASAGVSGFSDEEISAVLEATNTPDARRVVQLVEKELDERDPRYFGRLGSSIRSRQPTRVQVTVAQAYEDMLTAPTMLEAVESAPVAGYVPGEIGTTCGLAVVVAVGVAIAVTAVAAVNYVLAANVAAGYNVAVGTNVAYQVNKVKTRSRSLNSSERFAPAVVAATVNVFGQ